MDVIKQTIRKVIEKVGLYAPALIRHSVMYCFGNYAELILTHGISRKQVRDRIKYRVERMRATKSMNLYRRHMKLQYQSFALPQGRRDDMNRRK